MLTVSFQITGHSASQTLFDEECTCLWKLAAIPHIRRETLAPLVKTCQNVLLTL